MMYWVGAGRERGRKSRVRLREEGQVESMEDKSIVEETTEREVEAQEERYSSDASVGSKARFVLAERGRGSTKGRQKRW